MTTNFVYIIYIRARRNQHQWVYSLWPGWYRQPAPSSFTLLCNLHHHPLHYSATCTISLYTTMKLAPSSVTWLCSLHHHQLPYPAVCTINHQLPYPAACTIISYPTLQPAPSSVTLLCSLHHHQLPFSAACTIISYPTACTIISYPTLQPAPSSATLPFSSISYPTLQPAPSSVTLLCSLQQNPYPVTEPSLLHLVWTACANFSSWSQYCWLMTERPGVKHSERWPMSQWLCMCKRKRYTLTGNNNGVL